VASTATRAVRRLFRCAPRNRRTVSPTALNPSDFQPYLTASIGVDRIVPATGPSQQHIAFLIGGGLNYKPANGVWVNLFEARYARLPGLATNTAIISSGFTLNF